MSSPTAVMVAAHPPACPRERLLDQQPPPTCRGAVGHAGQRGRLS